MGTLNNRQGSVDPPGHDAANIPQPNLRRPSWISALKLIIFALAGVSYYHTIISKDTVAVGSSLHKNAYHNNTINVTSSSPSSSPNKTITIEPPTKHHPIPTSVAIAVGDELKKKKEKKKVAIMIAGGVRTYEVTIWESIRTHVVSPIQEHYDAKLIIDVFFCASKADMAHSNLQQHITATQRKTFIGDGDIGIHFFPFDAKKQFDRNAMCYQKLNEFLKKDGNGVNKGDDQQHQPYDFIIRTRPDLWWFHSIPLPFSENHVMGRTRMAQGVKLITAQMSYLACGPCPSEDTKNGPAIHSPRCIMVDDQLAVVPRVYQERFFRGPQAKSSNTHIDFNYTVNVGDDAVIVNDVNVNWPVFKLETSETCSCVNYWPEGSLTNALANLDVTYMVAPFHVRLTEKDGVGFRWDGGHKHFDAIHNCK